MAPAKNRSKNLLALLLLLAGALLLLPLATPTQAASVYIVDNDNDVSSSSSVAVLNNRPVISYYDSTNLDLMAAICGDASCTTFTNSNRRLDSTGDAGRYSAVTTATGNPVIAYKANSALNVAACVDPTCASTPTITTVGLSYTGQKPAIKVVGGNPIVSYIADDPSSSNPADQIIRVVACTDATCTAAPVSSSIYSGSALGPDTAMTIVGGKAVIAFVDGSSLIIAACSNPTCTTAPTTSIDSVSSYNQGFSITTLNGTPIISYLKFWGTYSSLNVAACSTADCRGTGAVTISLLNTGSYLSDTAITAMNGVANIAYQAQENSNYPVSLAICVNALCTSAFTQVLDRTGNLRDVSIANVNGSPGISYVNIADSRLKFYYAGSEFYGLTTTPTASPTSTLSGPGTPTPTPSFTAMPPPVKSPTPFFLPTVEATFIPQIVGASGAHFGYSVAISGANTALETVAVGAPDTNSTGMVYLFDQNGAVWTQIAQLTAPDGASGDRFGASVAINRDVLFVGAPGDDDNGSDSGSVYIFNRVGASWQYQSKLHAPDASAGSQFGFSVAMSGTSMIAGAPYDDQPAFPDIGSAYVFSGAVANWTFEQQLSSAYTPPYPTAGEHFGYSVDIYGDEVVVGAPDGGTGHAYPYNRINAIWYLQFPLFGGTAGSQFGHAVAIYHDLIVVGSPGYASGSEVNNGRVSMYKWDGSTFAPFGTDYVAFSGSKAGSSVDAYRDTILEGGPEATSEAGPSRGEVMLAVPNKLFISATQSSLDAQYGFAVARFGNTIVVGSPGETFGVANNLAGVVYIYNIPGPPWETPTVTPAHYWPTSTFVVPTATRQTGTPTLTVTPTESPIVPTPVTATSPASAVPERNFYTTHTPTLTWTGVTGAVGYELQLSGTFNFSSLIPVPNPLTASSLAYTTGYLPNGTYYWQVRGITSKGVSGWSLTESFVISAPPDTATAPPPPTLPGGGCTDNCG